MYKVVVGMIEFYLTGRNIFIIYNQQKLVIKNKDRTDLTPTQYAGLCDDIYRRKIKGSQELFSLYADCRLDRTSRSLK